MSARLASARWLRVALPLAFLILVAGAARWLLQRPPSVQQPVAFNHRMHTEQLKIACQLCHQNASTGAHAGLPSAQMCAMCHQVRQGTSPESARLTALLASGSAFRFTKLFHLPPYVYFTHRRHVGIAKLPCDKCHGAIASTERPPERPLVTIRMRVCLGCHQAARQTVDCVACHR